MWYFWIKKFADLDSSTFCIRKIYSLIDFTLDKIIKKLNEEEIKSIAVQLINIIYLMTKYNYIHGDFHFGNVGVVKTTKKTIKKIKEYL
jgi:5-methylthioribose kinase